MMEDNILQQESFALEIVLVKNSSVDHHLMLMPWMLNSTDAGDTHFEIPAWRITLWSVVFGLMVISSCFGNAFVIRIVLSDKKMCTVTNYFLVNLAVSDMLLSTFNTVFSFISMVTYNWRFGRIMCTINQYVAVLSVACSSFTLVAISLERYMAIVHPLRKRMSKLTTSICISIVWLMSLFIALPHAIYATVNDVDEEHQSANRFVCQLIWPDGSTFDSLQEFVYNYNISLTLATYCVPITAIGCLYVKIGLKLWKSQVIGETTVQQLEILQSKRKIVKMLVVVVVIFSTCWLPYHIYFLISWIYPSINEWRHIQDVYLAIYWLAMSSSMYNPFIYCWLNSRFRLGFKERLHCVTRNKIGISVQK